METQKAVQEISPKKQWQWIIGFNYFNLLDALLTLFCLQYLGGREINPVMALLINAGPVYFFSFKILFGLWATSVLTRRQAFISLRNVCFLFMAVCAWNLGQIAIKLGALEWILNK